MIDYWSIKTSNAKEFQPVPVVRLTCVIEGLIELEIEGQPESLNRKEIIDLVIDENIKTLLQKIMELL